MSRTETLSCLTPAFPVVDDSQGCYSSKIDLPLKEPKDPKLPIWTGRRVTDIEHNFTSQITITNSQYVYVKEEYTRLENGAMVKIEDELMASKQ